LWCEVVTKAKEEKCGTTEKITGDRLLLDFEDYETEITGEN
jgi:hypothetical protein